MLLIQIESSFYCMRKIKGSQNKLNAQREVAKASPPFYAAVHMMLHLSEFQSVACGLETACLMLDAGSKFWGLKSVGLNWGSAVTWQISGLFLWVANFACSSLNILHFY